jgi:hypothetical protein
MRIDYPKIKKYLHICTFSLDLLLFLIVLFSTDSSSKNYKKYTGSSLFFLDLYIILIYALLITISIFPKILYFKLKKYILFIFTDKGKVIISYLISIIYWFAGNKPQFILGVILTLTSTILLIYEFIFYFTKVESFLTNKGIQFENKDKPTFDMDLFEKDEKNNTTPLSNKNPGPNIVSKENTHNESEGNQDNIEVKDNNPNNIPETRDVEISNGFEKHEDGGDQGGFGFE